MGRKECYVLAASVVLGSGMCGCVAPGDSVTVDILNTPAYRLRREETVRYPPIAAAGKMPAAATQASTNILYRWETVSPQEQERYLRRFEEQQRRAPSIEERMYIPLRRDFPTEPRGISIIRFRF